jgi:hypothetical protein
MEPDSVNAMIDVVTNLIGHLIQANVIRVDQACGIVIEGAGDMGIPPIPA